MCNHDHKKGISRRSFMKGTTSGVAVLGAGAGVTALARKAHARPWMFPDTATEYPTSEQMTALRAICDTVIPNTDGPGAKEAGGADVIADPFYMLNPYISEVVADIDDSTHYVFWWWNCFWDQPLVDRTAVLEERLDTSLYADAYRGMILLAKLAFFGGSVNTVGYGYIGYPGPATGYYPEISASGLPLAIPDNNTTGVTKGLAVNLQGTISSLRVSLNINHTWRGDLVVKLIHPSGNWVYLTNRAGGSEDNFVLDKLQVADFNGLQAAGTWKLWISDQAAADVGNLNSWTLHIGAAGTQGPFDTCDYNYAEPTISSYANNCPSSWNGTNDGCDCGCQYFDPDCLL